MTRLRRSPQTALCVHHLVCAPPCVCTCVWTVKPPFASPRFAQHVVQPPHPPRITRRLRWPPTTLCVHRLVCGPPNNPLLRLASLNAGSNPRRLMTRLLRWTPTAFFVHRLECGPSNHPLRHLASLDAGASPHTPLYDNTPTVATNRLVCAPPCVCTTLCVHLCVDR